MNALLRQLTTEYRRRLEEICRKRLRGLSLFGSRARDEADSEPGVDLLIVLDRDDSHAAEIGRAREFNAELSLPYGVGISRVPVAEATRRTSALPFFASVREEAVPA